jgi:hypothetical protein
MVTTRLTFQDPGITTTRCHASPSGGPLPRAPLQIRARNSALSAQITIVKYDAQMKFISISDDGFQNDSRF